MRIVPHGCIGVRMQIGSVSSQSTWTAQAQSVSEAQVRMQKNQQEQEGQIVMSLINGAAKPPSGNHKIDVYA